MKSIMTGSSVVSEASLFRGALQLETRLQSVAVQRQALRQPPILSFLTTFLTRVVKAAWTESLRDGIDVRAQLFHLGVLPSDHCLLPVLVCDRPPGATLFWH